MACEITAQLFVALCRWVIRSQATESSRGLSISVRPFVMKQNGVPLDGHQNPSRTVPVCLAKQNTDEGDIGPAGQSMVPVNGARQLSIGGCRSVGQASGDVDTNVTQIGQRMLGSHLVCGKLQDKSNHVVSSCCMPNWRQTAYSPAYNSSVAQTIHFAVSHARSCPHGVVITVFSGVAVGGMNMCSPDRTCGSGALPVLVSIPRQRLACRGPQKPWYPAST